MDEFVAFATAHLELFFYVTHIGCGIAGFRDKEIAPLFKEAVGLENVCLPETFVKYLALALFGLTMVSVAHRISSIEQSGSWIYMYDEAGKKINTREAR